MEKPKSRRDDTKHKKKTNSHKKKKYQNDEDSDGDSDDEVDTSQKLQSESAWLSLRRPMIRMMIN